MIPKSSSSAIRRGSAPVSSTTSSSEYSEPRCAIENVNRRRIDSQHLEDGDEVQIGKYKLTFLSR